MLGINIALNASKIISGIRSENTSETISGIRSENAQKLYQEMYQNVYLETISESQSETISPSTSINLPKTTSYLSLPLFPFPINHNLIKIPTRPQHPKRLFDHPFISGGVEYDSFVLKPVFQNVF